MPRIPTAADLPAGTGRDLAGREVRVPQVAPPTAELLRIGEGVTALGLRLREERRGAEKAMALTDVTVMFPEQLDQALMQAQQEAAPGAKGFGAAFVSQGRTQLDQFMASLDERYDLDPNDRAQIAQRARAYLAVAHSAAIRFENTERQRLYGDSIERQLETISASAYRTGESSLALTRKETILRNAELALPPQKLVELNAQYDREIHMRTIQGKIRDDAFSTLIELRAGLYDELPLDSADIIALEDEALTEIKSTLALQDREEARAERARKDAQEDRATDLRIGVLEGRIGEGDVTAAAARREISLSQFSGLILFLRSDESQEDDHDLALSLRVGIHQGRIDADDVMAARDRLTPATARSLLDAADEVQRRGSTLARADVKRERERVDQIIGGIRGPLAILDTAASERTVTALDEFDTRVLDGENPRTVAEEVIDKYRRTAPTLAILGRRPRFFEGPLSGPRNELLGRALDAQQRTLQAMEQNEIDRQTALRELQRIDDYLVFIEQMEE